MLYSVTHFSSIIIPSRNIINIKQTLSEAKHSLIYQTNVHNQQVKGSFQVKQKSSSS